MVELGLEKPFAELSSQVVSRYWGKYRGIVDSVDDSDKQAKIVVKVPSVYGDEKSPPALPAVPFAGDKHGFLFLPEPGDGVWIEFEDGNPSLPIWTGFWWAKNELPSEAGADKRVIVTSKGLKVILDDDAGSISLMHKDKSEITLTDSSITLKVGGVKLVVDGQGVAINDIAFKVTK